MTLPDNTKEAINQLVHQTRYAEARDLNRQYCLENKTDLEALLLLSRINARLGETGEVAKCCAEIITLDPENAEACYNLGVIYLSQHNFSDAYQHFMLATRFAPDNAAAHLNLGISCMAQGKLAEAIIPLKEAVRITPDLASAHSTLGSVLQQQGKLEEAKQSYLKAIETQPDNAITHNNFAGLLIALEELSEAAVEYSRALQLNPDFTDALYSLGVVYLQTGELDRAIDNFRHTLELDPAYTAASSGLLYTLNNCLNISPEDITGEHRHLAGHFEKPVCGTHPNNPDQSRPLRVGYVSPDFRNHSVASFFYPLLENHNPCQVETVCYADVQNPDDMTSQLSLLAGQWRDINRLPDEAVFAMIQNDKIDILVDLAGHTAGNRLSIFARKPAPVQVSYLGYPNTTGLQEIDYRFTDSCADPEEESSELYTETLVRIPGGFLCYRPPVYAPPVTAPPSETAGHITFGSFNNLSKIIPEVITSWSLILKAVPDSRIILKNRSLADTAVRSRYFALFSENGIEQDRIELLHWSPSPTDHLGLYNRIDIALDTFPYNGTTTTCEALWMGVPVITVKGTSHAARVGYSLLSQTGLGSLVATDEAGYISQAVQLAGDHKNLAGLRREIRNRMEQSTLCDGKAFTQRLEAAYRVMWHDWCQATRGQHD